jgi:class 3 adenylate cyclase
MSTHTEITDFVRALDPDHLLKFIGDDLAAWFLKEIEDRAIEIAEHNPTEELETLKQLYQHQQETA